MPDVPYRGAFRPDLAVQAERAAARPDQALASKRSVVLSQVAWQELVGPTEPQLLGERSRRSRLLAVADRQRGFQDGL